MSNFQGTAIIRDRGQITIPEKIRRTLKWPTTNSVVSLATTVQNEILIRPYDSARKINWPQIWNNVELSRSYQGKKGNLSSFVSSDRENH